jgi:hypothetical protein
MANQRALIRRVICLLNGNCERRKIYDLRAGAIFQALVNQKSQITYLTDGEAPRTKLQAPEKFQAPIFKMRLPLKLEIWGFSGAWNLELFSATLDRLAVAATLRLIQ